MSATADSPPITPARRRRWLVPVVAVALLLILPAAGWLYFSVDGPWTGADAHHRHVLRRIHTHYGRAMATFPSDNPTDRMTQKERGRYEIVRAIGTAMGNWPFFYRQNCLPGKVQAIADRLDATDGAELKTFEGCCDLLVMCDEASWMFYDYPWTEKLREMDADGTIPKLPVLGKRWENDTRYKAYKDDLIEAQK